MVNLVKKNNVLTLFLLILINSLIVYFSDGDAARYISIKYLLPERGIDITLSILNIAVVVLSLTMIIMDALELKELIIIRIGKKNYNHLIMMKWSYLILLFVFCNACFEQYVFHQMYILHLILSCLSILALYPLFIKFTKTNYYFILCMISIFMTHIIFQLLL